MKNVLSITFLLAAIVLGVVAYGCHQRELRFRHAFETIPLRDDMRKEFVIELTEPVGIVRLLDDSHLVYTSGFDLVIRNFRDTTEPVRRLRGHSATIGDFDISPNGKKIVTASSDGTVRLWDARTGEALAVSRQLDTLDQPNWTMLMDVTFTRKGRRILTADMRGIKEWRTRDCRLLRAEESDIFYLRWGLIAPDGKTCCAPIIQGGNEIMDRSGKRLMASKKPEEILCYSPDGSTLLLAPEEERPMYYLNIRRLLRRDGTVGLTPFIGADSTMVSAAFSRDLTQVVSASTDGKVYVWNAFHGCLRETLPTGESGLNHVDFDPTGTWVLAADSHIGRIHIWGPRVWVY